MSDFSHTTLLFGMTFFMVSWDDLVGIRQVDAKPRLKYGHKKTPLLKIKRGVLYDLL